VKGNGNSSSIVQFQKTEYYSNISGPRNFAMVTVFNTPQGQKNFTIVSEVPIRSVVKKVESIQRGISKTTNIVVDIDGNRYKTRRIGKMEWMIENLNVIHFCNGVSIPEARTKEEWDKAGDEQQPAWCYPDNDPEKGKKYGKLYNWYSVNDLRKLAPKGWHIPSSKEWDQITGFLNGDIGYRIDDFFMILPGGNRNCGYFKHIGGVESWWSSKDYNPTYAWSRWLTVEGISKEGDYKGDGLSVCCLKD
jgi:hypothetical protein